MAEAAGLCGVRESHVSQSMVFSGSPPPRWEDAVLRRQLWSQCGARLAPSKHQLLLKGAGSACWNSSAFQTYLKKVIWGDLASVTPWPPVSNLGQECPPTVSSKNPLGTQLLL